MNVGFTGSRYGMSSAQKRQLEYMLALFKHADQAVGRQPRLHYGTHETVVLVSDEYAAAVAKRLGYILVPHHAKRGEELARDEEEAAACDVMIATPMHDRERDALRSGTWATMRYAQRLGKPVIHLARG